MSILDLKSLASVQDVPIIISTITGRELIDIFVVSIAIYVILLFVKQTKSYFVLSVSLFLIALNFFSQNLNLSLTRSILQPLSTLTFIIIAIVFQREIRRFFRWITTGQQNLFSRTHTISRGVSAEIAEAALFMAEKRIGGIFVFPGKQEIDDIIEGGQPLNGMITKELLLSIFDTSSPGHDGAVIIESDMIKSFGVHLPLARNYNFRKAGTRHRASAGITEDTDSIAIVISEERGQISMAKGGKLEKIKDEAALRALLKELTGETSDVPQGFWRYFFISNVGTKGVAVSVAFVLWTVLVMQTGVVKKEFSVPLSFQLLSNAYEVDTKGGKTQINVVLQGRSTDITSLDPSKVEVKIDAKDFATGTIPLSITENMISVPPYLSVIEIAPTKVNITVKEKSAPQEAAEDKII